MIVGFYIGGIYLAAGYGIAELGNWWNRRESQPEWNAAELLLLTFGWPGILASAFYEAWKEPRK